MAQRIRKDDTVLVITGKDKGKTGKVTRVIPDENKVVVAGVNVAKVHKKPTSTSAGQIISIEKAIHVSNISLIEDGKPAKVGFKIEDDEKVRYFKKSGNKVGK
jgi:large subunit ribosomal protein L24